MSNRWFASLTREQRKILYEKKRKYRLKVKLLAFDILGKICRCGFSDHRALQLDHIFGGGTKERNGQIKTDKVISYYLWIIKNPELAKKKFQLLCANCNWIKRSEKQEYLPRIVRQIKED